jgi:hypothetical protein
MQGQEHCYLCHGKGHHTYYDIEMGMDITVNCNNDAGPAPVPAYTPPPTQEQLDNLAPHEAILLNNHYNDNQRTS